MPPVPPGWHTMLVTTLQMYHNTSEGSISLYEYKPDTVEEGLGATDMRTDMLTTNPNNVNSKQVNKKVRILSPNLKLDTDTREVGERVSKNAQEVHSEQIEDISLVTALLRWDYPEIKQSVSLVASSPLSEMSEDCSRSPHQTMKGMCTWTVLYLQQL